MPRGLISFGFAISAKTPQSCKEQLKQVLNHLNLCNWLNYSRLLNISVSGRGGGHLCIPLVFICQYWGYGGAINPVLCELLHIKILLKELWITFPAHHDGSRHYFCQTNKSQDSQWKLKRRWSFASVIWRTIKIFSFYWRQEGSMVSFYCYLKL